MGFMTAAAIASLLGTAVSAGQSIFGGNQQQQQSFDILARQLAQNQANIQSTAAGVGNLNQLARAGFSDSQGSSLRYDPATGQWVSTLGALPQQAQTASDQATIARNTTDFRQAQGANERADLNAARAQPLINAAMLRMSQFRPQTADDLTGLLQQDAVEANNQAFRPVVADTLRQFTRSEQNAGPVLAQLGARDAQSMRQALLEARIQGLTNVEGLNNQRRQGLQSDLGAALTAGTPQFQYPQIAANNPNKDMLAALTQRASAAGLTSAYGLNALTNATTAGNTAAANAASRVPDPNANLTGLATGLDTISNTLQNKNIQKGLSGLSGLFGSDSSLPPVDNSATRFALDDRLRQVPH